MFARKGIFAFLLLAVALSSVSAMAQQTDCVSERPLTSAQLMALARAPGARTLEGFLRSIPQGALQTVTLLHGTDSRAQDAVTPSTPRVVRSTADGRLTIAYSCTPGTDSYGKVEVIAFNSRTGRAETTELNFNQPPRAAHRVVRNPADCRQCHGDPQNPNGMLRPNWARYPQWDHAYGSNDDSLGETPQGRQEWRNYVNFLAAQRDNPCYSTLPGLRFPPPGTTPVEDVPPVIGLSDAEQAAAVPEEPAIYPYTLRRKPLDLGLRPNLRLTAAWARLQGRQVYEQVFRGFTAAERQEAQFALAYGAFCSDVGGRVTTEVDQARPSKAGEHIEALFPGTFVNGELSRRPGYAYASNLVRAVGHARGIAPRDWSLLFPNTTDHYTTGFTDRSDIEDMFHDELIQNLIRTDQDVARVLVGSDLTTNRRTIPYGSEYECITGGQYSAITGFNPGNTTEEYTRFCEVIDTRRLELARRAGRRSIVAPIPAPVAAAVAPAGAGCEMPQQLQDPTGVAVPIAPLQAVRGATLVQESCLSCHQNGLGTVSVSVVQQHLSGALTLMPPTGALTADEQQAVLEYLRQLSQPQ